MNRFALLASVPALLLACGGATHARQGAPEVTHMALSLRLELEAPAEVPPDIAPEHDSTSPAPPQTRITLVLLDRSGAEEAYAVATIAGVCTYERPHGRELLRVGCGWPSAATPVTVRATPGAVHVFTADAPTLSIPVPRHVAWNPIAPASVTAPR
ncbi:MAG: hypothetical protein KC417_06140 [Myxococcales bacterium]|nr:hypothetical protein [Myxococcales bacterium]